MTCEYFICKYNLTGMISTIVVSKWHWPHVHFVNSSCPNLTFQRNIWRSMVQSRLRISKRHQLELLGGNSYQAGIESSCIWQQRCGTSCQRMFVAKMCFQGHLWSKSWKRVCWGLLSVCPPQELKPVWSWKSIKRKHHTWIWFWLFLEAGHWTKWFWSDTVWPVVHFHVYVINFPSKILRGISCKSCSKFAHQWVMRISRSY